MIFFNALHQWSKFGNNQTSFGGVIPKKPPKSSLKSPFLVLEKHFKTHNFGTRNAMLMKLTTNMYLHETFHLAKNWGVTHNA